MHRNDKLVMIMNMIELESSKTANERDNNVYPKGVFCTSLTLAKITGKNHYDVIKDIDSVKENIKDFGIKLGESKFVSANENVDYKKLGGSKISVINENQRFVISKAVYPRERFKEATYIDSLNRQKKMYYLDEVAYLTMMGKYNDTITYLLALFYVKTRRKIRSVYERLMYTSPKAIMLAKDIVSYKQTNPIVNTNVQQEINTKIELLNNFNKYVREIDVIRSHYNDNFLEDPNFSRNPNIYSTSIEVSKMLGKEHKHVMRDIRVIEDHIRLNGVEQEFGCFNPSTYISLQNKVLPMYELNEVGFITLMGHYFDYIVYQLAEYYVETKHFLGVTNDELLQVPMDVLNQAWIVATFIEQTEGWWKGEINNNRVNKNPLKDEDYFNAQLKGCISDIENAQQDYIKFLNEYLGG